ncbi:hypothetical protein NQ317_011162 [Molorchus minor]|uniref:RING-CH-type domain-containing protein n=1 Tax=Molorchus minor TaxID=1323400 RepID=A0ABQ9IVE7_9CUCU|nr:hypothetical protein NQ317_011162 [Molorchus minor]
MLRHLFVMSGLASRCTRDCSGRGECYNGTCMCDIRFTGELCDGPNLPYHAGIGGVFFFIGVVCAIQLIMCIISEYTRLKAPTFLRACKITTQKLIYFVICLASLIRGAYFIFPHIVVTMSKNLFEYGWSSSLLSSYYPLLMSKVASLIVCFWAEVFHLQGVHWEKPQFLSKSFLGFITFNIISYSLLFAEVITTQLAEPPPSDPSFYHHLFNGCYAVLMFIVVVFFLIYGVEVYFKVRGGFVAKPLQLASNTLETEPLQNKPELRPQINISQLHQSRIGLLSQALMLIIIAGFLFSETLSNSGRPRKLLAKFDQPKNVDNVDSSPSGTLDTSIGDSELFLDKRECWICYDGDKADPLIQPCDCTGDVSSMANGKLFGSNEPLRCKVCKYEYDVRRSSEVKWDRGFTAHHWGSTAVVVTCMCVTVAGAWIIIQLYDNSYIRMFSASIALLVIYICIR